MDETLKVGDEIIYTGKGEFPNHAKINETGILIATGNRDTFQIDGKNRTKEIAKVLWYETSLDNKERTYLVWLDNIAKT